ncbi:MAG: restriction endonuclease subunit S [Eubacterium sp.]|nr:restriction endonuclease subunit S [Eubacterium sp.]
MRIKDICESITDGSHNPPQGGDISEFMMISSKNIFDDHITLDEPRYLTEEQFFSENKRTNISAGDVLMTIVGTVGRAAVVPVGFTGITLQRSVAVLHPRKEKCDSRYLMYALQSKRSTFEKEAHGVAQKGIYLKQLADIDIDLPDIAEQTRVVGLLDKINGVINKRRDEIELLDNIIKARFVELFEDGESPLKTIEELCSEIVDCPHTTPKYEGDLKNPAIRTSEIKKGYITWDSMKYVSDEEYEERVSRLRPKAGDIVYGREGTFGNAAVLPEGYKFCLGQRVMLLRPDYTKCTSEYLLHAVISDDVYRQAVGKNNASTVAHVNVKDVKQFKVPLPSFDKQNQFADFVKQVDKSKVVVQKALDEAQLLFDSLMQEYFG